MFEPLISVLVPVYNVEARWLERCIKSILDQSYEKWELILCNDKSTLQETLDVLERFSEHHKIKVIHNEENLGISLTTNHAAKHASGEFYSLLDNDDEYHPDALMSVVEELKKYPEADFIYTDEDKLSLEGNRCDDYLKPDFSQEHLMSVMYVLHLMCFKKELFDKVGGFRHECMGAQDYDLALRMTEKARCIRHIPKILYHWRKIPGSSATEADAKGYAYKAAAKAISDFSSQKYPNSKVEPGQYFGSFRVRPSIPERASITLIIPTNDASADIPGKGRVHLLRNLLISIFEKSTYENFDVLVVDNYNASEETKACIQTYEKAKLISFNYKGKEFNFADKANFAFSHAKGEYIILLNDDMEVINGDWIEALLEAMQFENVGIVGSRLRFFDNTIQHAGVVLTGELACAHLFYSFPVDRVNYSGYSHLIRQYSAVTGAGMIMKRKLVEELGGFDNVFQIDYNDIDFALRAGRAGYKVLFTPYSELYHYEGKTEVRSYPKLETIELFKKRWDSLIENDPYHNKQLTRQPYIKNVL